ncbi:MAG: PAS domain S-box protein [Thermoanaerobaculia bacterium]
MNRSTPRSEAALASLRRRAPLTTAIIYIAISLVWIFLSDPLMLRMVDEGNLVTFSVIKGAIWVTVSGLVLYLLVFRHVKRLAQLEEEARTRLLEGEMAGGFGTIEWGKDGLRWSSGMYRLFGLQPGSNDPSLATMLGLIAPDDRGRFRDALAAAESGKVVEPFDLQIKGADGVEKTVRAHLNLRDQTVFAALQDVSRLRTAEYEALHSAGILQAALEATADGIMVYSADGKILAWNRLFSEIFGFDEELMRTATEPQLLALALPQVRNAERFGAWIEELGRQPEIACFDLIELVDGRIFERYTAPVYLGGTPSARIASYRDATDRIRAHERVQSRERHLEASQKIAQIGSFEWDLDAGTVEWSEGMFLIYGVPPVPGPLPHDFGGQFRHPDDREVIRRTMARIAEGEKEGSARYRILKPGGEIRWIEARAEVIERNGHRILFGVIRDVTERRQAREAVREAEERFRATFEQAAVGIAHLSPAGAFIRFNERLTTILQREREEIEQKQFQDLVWEEDLENAETTLALVGRGEVRSLSRELRLVRSHGGPVWVEMTVTAVDSVEDSRYLLAVFQDVSARKLIETERLELIRNVRLLLESTSAGLFAVDEQGLCTLINQAACTMLGYGESDLVGRQIHDLIHSDSEEEKCPIADGRIPTSEKRVYNQTFRRRGGESLPCDVIVSPITERGETIGAAVSFVDISERRLLETQLERSDRLASLGRLAATIAHEMNNVMMGILPFAEVVARNEDASIARAGDQIRHSVQRGKRITQEILRFTRPVETARKPLEIEGWLRSVGGELEAVVRQSATWRLITPGRPLWVEADADQLGQVLTNLIANSVDAVASTGKPGLIELSVDVSPAGASFPFGHLPTGGAEYAHFILRDTGKGMDPDVVEHAFEPFFTTKRKGTGLGLAIAHKLLAAQGGLLFVESTLGEGTAFHAFLPIIEAPSEESVPVTSAGQGRRPGMYRLLLVEDDPTVAAGIVASLEFEGSTVELVGTGGGGLEALERFTPDAVILDVGLPDIDGAEVCRRIAVRWPTLPVLFSTGHGDASRLEDLLAAPHRSFLMKPYTIEDLHAALEEITGGPGGGGSFPPPGEAP